MCDMDADNPPPPTTPLADTVRMRFCVQHEAWSCVGPASVDPKSPGTTALVAEALTRAGTTDPALTWLFASSWSGAGATPGCHAMCDAMGRALAAGLLV